MTPIDNLDVSELDVEFIAAHVHELTSEELCGWNSAETEP
jgi:hypothetical protein